MSAQPFSGSLDVSHLHAARYAREGVYFPVREDMDREEVELIVGALSKIRREALLVA